MAKYVAQPIGTGFGAQSNLNQNFEDIEDNFQRVLYRDGSSPNQMETDLDMNSNDIINVNNINTQSLAINGQQVVANETFVTPLPDPVGQSGKFIRSDGISASWQALTKQDVDGIAVIPVDTVADMKALTGLSDGALVQPLGYYTKGDLPLSPRIFIVDATPPADNGGSVIHDDAGVGYFFMPISTYVYAWDFGCIADWNGTTGTDNEPMIMAALGAMTEGVLVFQQGDYKILDEIIETRNNIHLYGIGTATFVVPSTVSTTTGVAINFYDNVSTQPVNSFLHNINVDISTNGGGNSGGIRYGGSYGGFQNVNIRIRGDNMTGLILQNDDAGTGPYYNEFERVYVQGDSTSGTPLTGTKGFDLRSSTLTPSRSPNTNQFTKCRAGGVYDGYTIRGAGNMFTSCTSEAINNYHYNCLHVSVASGSTRNVIINPYCENQPTSTVFYCNTNASGNVMIQPYYTGVSAVFTDASTNQNNRLIDTDNLPVTGAPRIKAAVNATGTTVNAGFNIASVTTTGTGLWRMNFTTNMANTNYFPYAIAVDSDLYVRVSTRNVAFVQFAFFNAGGVLTNPTGFIGRVETL